MPTSKLFSKIHNPLPEPRRPVLTFGGFPGQYNEISVDQLAALVQSGRLRFVLSQGPQGHQEIAQWVQKNCTQVDTRCSRLRIKRLFPARSPLKPGRVGLWRLRMTEISRRPKWLVQAIKFGAVGILNTGIDLGLYFVLTRWLGLGSLPVLAKSLSYSAGILNSFLWNKFWTFQSRAGTWATLIPFILTALAGLGINTGMLQVCLNSLHLPELVALGAATLTTLAWNFLISNFVILRNE